MFVGQKQSDGFLITTVRFVFALSVQKESELAGLLYP